MTATSLNTRIKIAEPEFYKGFTIELNKSLGLQLGKFICYPTKQGIDHDYDQDSDGYHYCGNCKLADSIEEAKLLIDEIVPFLVETHGPIPLGGHAQLHVTKFNWLSDAVRFASKFNGSLNVNFNSI
jgi:hypothetical protein